MLEKYHLMPNLWDPDYPYNFLIPKLVRDLEDKALLEMAAEAKSAKQIADAQRAAQAKGAKR